MWEQNTSHNVIVGEKYKEWKTYTSCFRLTVNHCPTTSKSLFYAKHEILNNFIFIFLNIWF